MSYSYEQISFVGFLLLPLVMMSLSLLFQAFVFILDWADDWETRHSNMFHVMVGKAFGMELRRQWWREERRWETRDSFEYFLPAWLPGMVAIPMTIGFLLGPLTFLIMEWEYSWSLPLIPVLPFLLRWGKRRWKKRLAEKTTTVDMMKGKGRGRLW